VANVNSKVSSSTEPVNVSSEETAISSNCRDVPQSVSSTIDMGAMLGHMVNNFIYLGSCITKDNNEQVEIQRRLKLADKSYYSLYAIMKSRDIYKKTKIRLYKTLI
jgi:hypothetical protein